ncbi:SusC/RagA family TonB-linked outer membrane protein [Membranihabitans maritimus]|uniref:SusC/RagA family TonB-linked outer membrane protein n=1 Tax=Membranihabitans maritimus TaxID=2904244 RepID=UPI001F32BC25|nr:TonB-dependent receptor [Membranihabitans maritimus]
MKTTLIHIILQVGVFILCLFTNLTVTAQESQGQVTGKVTDQAGEPLIGVNVLVEGTNNGTSTDFEGEFTLQNVKLDSDALVISYIGYKTITLPISGESNMTITLESDSEVLDEVVVVGYGSQSREELTTSVTKLDEKVLENVPYANAATAMQGAVSGVRVQTTTGQPGASPRIIVRGGTSINNPNGASPLYVIDGVIRSNMDNIDANDIESIQVLKDAASTAIYGARGSNGVVVITTKSGESGNNKISYNYNLMFSQVGKTYDMVPARDFIKFYRQGVVAISRKIPERLSLLDQATPGGTGNDLTANTSYTTQYLTSENEHKLNEGWESMPDPVDPSKTIIFKGTDWQDVLFRTGVSHDHSLSFSGGNDKGTFNLGLGYLDNEGTAIGTFYNRFSLNFNGDLKIRDDLTAYSRLIFSKSSHRGEGWGYERGQAIAPTAKYRLEDGTLARNAHPSYRNPEYYNNSQDIKNGEDNLTIAIGADWDILPGLSFEPQISMFSTAINERFFQQASYINSPTTFVDTRTATGYHSNLTQYQADAILSYIKSINNTHNFSIKGGFSYFNRENSSLDARGQGAASDLIPTLNASAVPVSVSGFESQQLILGYFARLNYNFDQKYLVSLNGRYDGASNLGENYKWGFFPGVSLGWNLHREDFWNTSDLLSRLKLRGSYGVNGNISGLGDYESQGVYSVGRQYGGNSAILNTVLANPQLQWERSKTVNFGVDIGLFNDRINIISDIYSRITDNLLTSLPLPPTTGFSSIRTNLGSLENKGFEIEVMSKILPSTSDFQWDLSFNASFVKNKVVELPDNGIENNRVGGYYLWDPSINDYSWQGGIQEGQALGNIYGFVQEKIYATDEEAMEDPVVDMIVTVTDKTKYGGDVKWKDVDNNGVIDLRDRVYMGNVYPTWTGGISNYFNYRNFTLGIRMDYTVGHTKYDWSRALILAVYGTRSGLTSDVYDSWQEPGDNASYPQVYWADQQTQRNIARTQGDVNGGNSIFYQPGNFLALRELTLSYSFPKKLIERTGLSNLSLNATGNNLHYFTKFRGLSPEDGGRDAGTYPIPKNVVFGLRVNF